MQKLTKEELIKYFEEGCTSKEDWRIGVEHEKFLFDSNTFQRIPYSGEKGISKLLQAFVEKGWDGHFENGHLLSVKKNGASITLEPGGQFELSGAALKDIHQITEETNNHFRELSALASDFNMRIACLGFDPISKREDIHWIPKERYKIMRKHMLAQDSLGIDMMSRTATIQVNLDYSDEADMSKKMYVGQFLQPLVMALFANSPFLERKWSGYKSYRSYVWEHTDSNRCRYLPFLLNKEFTFEKWVDYLLQVPILFIKRSDKYIPLKNITFQQFLEGKTEYTPTIEDWEIQISTVFPDIRLKRYIEMRGADGACPCKVSALAAFWVGLLYNNEALDEVYEYVAQYSLVDFENYRWDVPKKALHTKLTGSTLFDHSRTILHIAERGLESRAKELKMESEIKYLKPLWEILDSKTTQSELSLEKFNTVWNKDIFKVFHDCKCEIT